MKFLAYLALDRQMSHPASVAFIPTICECKPQAAVHTIRKRTGHEVTLRDVPLESLQVGSVSSPGAATEPHTNAPTIASPGIPRVLQHRQHPLL
jgi:hypothetical protein